MTNKDLQTKLSNMDPDATVWFVKENGDSVPISHTRQIKVYGDKPEEDFIAIELR